MRPHHLALIPFLVAACGNDGPQDQPPPPICHTPQAPSGAWFSDVTTTALPAGVIATAVRAGDLDGDGYPDLLTTTVQSERQTADAPQRFLLLNRPSPSDPTQRVFVDATADSGILQTRDGKGGRGFASASLGDLDNDGDLDVVVCPGDTNGDDPCDALLNDGTAHFTLAPTSDLVSEDFFQSNSGALFDFDRDGNLDYWPGAFGTQPHLYKGHGDGTFTEVGPAMGLPTVDGDPTMSASYRQTFGVTACDLDGDGDLDVLLADYGREANQVWRNDGDKFTEVGMALGVAWDDRMDYSDDQSYDCWCSQNAGSCPMSVPAPLIVCDNPCNPNVERCWIPGQSDQPWRLGGNTFSIACGDLDDDGDMDLMTAEIRHWDVGTASDPSEILRNDTPAGQPLAKFVRPGNMATGIYRKETGGWNEGDMMPVFADVDLDGRKDIYLTSSDYPGDHGWLWHQKADHTFEDVTMASGAGQAEPHGVALVDIDRDGDLDLLLGTSTARGVEKTQALRLYRNDLGANANYLQVHLVGGAGSNRSAIGARVAVTAGGHTQIQEVSGGYGHDTIQNDLVLTFGLGAACTVDAIEVRWPDAAATKQTFTSVEANYRVELTQGDPKVHYLLPPATK